ncbi:MOSC domain-containing protein [Pseudoprimorskyibacter insulae]|uniref:MOSC domain-containing protein n=1 Tax=Pseudoprimorskyibacter insulae TaxID=1695997 RepID=A0A2R8APH9_9RHOB|nr:MOSC N-terminal beta barrel domain-containing protein [Pseudoprimorskyibacter insulae]SPF77797.1 hypothetical protein PRI8871_00383 [Pseudoprimorskyibacter insulae]
MTAQVTEIWRHPIKSHGREAIDRVALSEGQTLPYDRLWAVAHEASDADGTKWATCHGFSRGSQAPELAAIWASLDEASERITLTHPKRSPLTFHPDTESDKLIDWTRGFIPEGRAQSARIVRGQTTGFPDTESTITIGNMSSHRAVEQWFGRPLSIHRWRCNIWVDGLAPWEEFDWMDRDIQIGSAVLRVVERTDRCLHTAANPETGRRDVDTLALLDHWNHRDFTVRAQVVTAGVVAKGDTVQRV